MTPSRHITILIRSVIPFALQITICFLLLLGHTLFCIAEAAAAEAFEVVIVGVEGPIKENVEAALAIPNGLIRDGRVEPVWARRFARQAPTRALHALEPFGYYDPIITAELSPQTVGDYRLTVTIDPGMPVRVGDISIHLAGPGAEQDRLKRLITNFPLTPGAPLLHTLYEESKAQLVVTAAELGYLDAHFTRHEILLSRETLLAEINLELETGPKYSFGNVTFQGAQDFPETFLRRYLTFTTGETFVESKLAQTQSNLLDADKFRSVRITADRNLAEDQAVPVQIVLEPMPRYQLRPGVGYGTDTGPRTSLSFRDINTLHLGHELRAELLFAELRQSLSSHYLIPLADQLDSVLIFTALFNHETNDSFEAQSRSLEARVTHGLPKDYKASLYLNLSQETYEVGDEESRVTTLVMPGVRLGKRLWKFDSPGRPRNGYAWQVEVRGSSATLGSDVSLLQVMVSGSTIVRLPWESQLILRAEGGTTLQNNFDDVPASMRFFAGGDQSVRGYGYKTLGPEDSNGDVVGGRHLAVGSAEVERRLDKNWSLALFYDTGNAFDDLNSYELAQGAGIGVRRHTVIGPIKFDLARQIGEEHNHYRIHLSIGFSW
jgi:translocation and assembly module TamA